MRRSDVIRVAGKPSPRPRQPGSDWRYWTQVFASALPGLAAVIALAFTAQSLRATNTQLAENRQQVDITEQGQITDRFNAAISNLASSNPVIQLGGIYALQRIMTDSARDQPAVLDVLCDYIRDHDSLPGNPSSHRRWPPIQQPPAGIQAALTVIGSRNPTRDGPALVNLENTNLADMHMSGAYLAGADMEGANLADADLSDARLATADITLGQSDWY